MKIARLFAAACLAVTCLVAVALRPAPSEAQHPPRAHGDPREAIALAPAETAELLAGMRTYLETIQGIVTALAENDVKSVAEIASRSGARMLSDVSPLTGLKTPIGFTSMSLDTHDKFDRLADAARRGTSRSEVLAALRDIMGNCISCHAAYRLAP